MRRLVAAATVLLAACGGEVDTFEELGMHEPPSAGGEAPDDARDPRPDAEPADGEGGEKAIEDGPLGFIGSPCEIDADCAYEGGVCLADGFARGTCSLPCDRFCPDLEAHPTTFCVTVDALPESARRLGSPGACVARCEYGLFPETGCRPGYACSAEARANEPATERYACVPGDPGPGTGGCLAELAAMGVSFEPTVIPDRSPSTHPNLVCHVEEPVLLHSPIHGVDLAYYDGSPTPTVKAACSMAKTLVTTIDDVRPHGVTALLHVGTYNCRVISGTDRLSRHAYGDAIDIYGFELGPGVRYTLVDHWEHDTEMPVSDGARFLYDAAHRWHDARYWAVILTPNYNAAHDNHFHVDLTPGSHFLFGPGGYIGPAPYVD